MNGRLTDTPHVGVWVAGRAQFGHLVFTRSHLKLSQIYTPAIDHDATTWNGSCYRSHWMLLPRSGSLLCKSAPLPFLRTALSRHWVAPTERQTSPQSCRSLCTIPMSAMRTKLPFPMRAPMAASHSLFPRVVKERGAITDLIQPAK